MISWLLQRLEQELELCQLHHWFSSILPLVETNFDGNRGNIRHFSELLQTLPDNQEMPVVVHNGRICVGNPDITSVATEQIARQLRPWRKGPFSFFSTKIDSEWQCQLKWNRLTSMIDIADLKILDVGGGNGYFGWRFLAEAAQTVVIIDPSPLYWAQFQLTRHFVEASPITMLPVRIESVPKGDCFDLVICMGVLYHSPMPFALIRKLRERLAPGGFLILETLVIDGDEQTVLVPAQSYASMKNVWAIPSIAATERWLNRCGLECVDIGTSVVTTNQEQRATDWSNDKSLTDFLDHHDQTKTIEGYPAPKRVIFKAQLQRNC